VVTESTRPCSPKATPSKGHADGGGLRWPGKGECPTPAAASAMHGRDGGQRAQQNGDRKAPMRLRTAMHPARPPRACRRGRHRGQRRRLGRSWTFTPCRLSIASTPCCVACRARPPYVQRVRHAATLPASWRVGSVGSCEYRDPLRSAIHRTARHGRCNSYCSGMTFSSINDA
jgi:hypothetical protein